MEATKKSPEHPHGTPGKSSIIEPHKGTIISTPTNGHTHPEAKISAQDILEEAQRLEQAASPFAGTLNGFDLIQMEINEIPVLWQPFLPQIGLAAFAGTSDLGKSTLARQLALAVCAGERHFLGFPLNPRHRREIIFSTEDDGRSLAVLLRKVNAELRYTEGSFQGLTFLTDLPDTLEELLQQLESMLAARPVDLVICDTFSDLFSGQLNEQNSVRRFLNHFRELAERHQCLFLFVHHTRKGNESLTPSKNNLVGSVGLEGKMRFVAELRKDPNELNLRHFCPVKGNYLPDSFKHESIVLSFSENMVFSSTSQRKPFSEIYQPDNRPPAQADPAPDIQTLENIFSIIMIPGQQYRYKTILQQLELRGICKRTKGQFLIKDALRLDIIQKTPSGEYTFSDPTNE